MKELIENQLRFAKVRPDALIPSKSDENAGYDIYANFSENVFVIKPHTTELVPTGIASALSEEYYLQVHERGSTGSKGMKYSAGVIDSSYRGEIFIAISNINDRPVVISKDGSTGDYKADEVILYPYKKAIAQLVVHKVHKMDIKEISYDELKQIPSERGEGKLGSSKK